MLTPVAQYIRLSSLSQINALAPQMEAISKFAAEKRYEIVRTYEDIGRSGVTQSKRSGLADLLRDIQDEVPFKILLVRDVSRWGRYQNPDEAAYLEFMCRLAGVRVIYCSEVFDDDGSFASSIQKSIRRVMAGEYSRQLSDRCRAGKRRAIQAGTRQGAAIPYGFARAVLDDYGVPLEILAKGERSMTQNRPVHVIAGPDEEVQTVRRIFHLFTKRFYNASEIADELNGEGSTYRGGEPWNHRRIDAVLSNELSIGIQCYNRTVWRFGVTERIPRSEWKRIRVLDPIVDPVVFRAAQAQIARSKHQKRSNADLIEKLRRVHRKHGRISRRLMESETGVPSQTTYVRRFGSMAVAYKLAGYNPSKRNRRRRSIALCGEAEILRLLTDLHKKHGRLNERIINTSPDLPRAATIATHFGGLRKVYTLISPSDPPPMTAL